MPDPNRHLSMEHTLEVEGTKCQNPKSMEPEMLVRVQWNMCCAVMFPVRNMSKFWSKLLKQEVKN